MSARNSSMLALLALLGSSLTLGACAEEDDPPIAGSGTGNVTTSGGSSSSLSSTSTGSTSDAGDGDGDSVGDGDGDSSGDGDGDASSSGDGDGDATTMGDGDGDTGATVYQECLDFQEAAAVCGFSTDDIQNEFDYCQTTFDYAADVGGACIGAAIQYWDCRTNLECPQFLVDGPGQCATDANVDVSCPEWPAP